jgi:hypothetical protein
MVNRLCGLAFSACAILPTPVLAQTSARPEPLMLIGGLSYGVGDTQFSPEAFVVSAVGLAGPQTLPRREGGLAKAAFAGVTVARRAAIVLDTDFTGAGASRFRSRMSTVGARYRLASRIWLGGGAGVGWLHYQPDSQAAKIRLSRGLALTAATGVEIAHWGPFALDLQARISTAGYGPLRVTRTAIELGYVVGLPLR